MRHTLYICCWTAFTSLTQSSSPSTSISTSKSRSSGPAKQSSTHALPSHSTGSITLCEQYGVYNTPTGNLTFNSDAWNRDNFGTSCVTINDSGASFEATWHWQSDASAVHSYPHVKFNAPTLPIPMWNISSIQLTAQWAMAPSSHSSSGSDGVGLSRIDAKANVALDMFVDVNVDSAQNETTAGFEIMIWLGSFGDPAPLGFSDGAACWNQSLSDVIFQLYSGKNTRGHQVFSWVSPMNLTDFNEDLSPLLQALWRRGLIPHDAHLGLVEFGSEAFHAKQNVTFKVPGFALDLASGPAPDLELPEIPKWCKKSEGLALSASIYVLFVVSSSISLLHLL